MAKLAVAVVAGAAPVETRVRQQALATRARLAFEAQPRGLRAVDVHEEQAHLHAAISQRSLSCSGCMSTRGRVVQDQERPATSPTTLNPAARRLPPPSATSV